MGYFKHPFEPQITKNSENMLIGTLPPENIDFYYSNSQNTRMWDILKAIQENMEEIPQNSYQLPIETKKEILAKLNLSMADIILEYQRKNDNSTKDEDIVPIKYSDIENIIKNTSVTNLLFVYKSALKWFLHSIEKETPAELSKLEKIKNSDYGIKCTVLLNGKEINCILLPNPLNRGKKGESLKEKKEIYQRWVQNAS